MTDLDINRRLALAIGWPRKRLWIEDDEVRLLEHIPGFYGPLWRVFDYTKWQVAGPIAARYNCFPWEDEDCKWVVYAPGYLSPPIYANTAQQAIALAVIAAHEAGVLK